MSKSFADLEKLSNWISQLSISLQKILIHTGADKTSRKRTIILLFTLLIIFVLIAIARFNNKNIPQSTKAPLIIKTFALGRVQPTGYIRSITYPMIYQSSRIKKLYVEENFLVRKGSPLFTVEDSNEAYFNMESSRAQLRQQIY